jgi:hypothetical protein
MSSSLNHYTADVQVTDAVMHNKTPLATSTFVIAVLAANVTDAQALIQEFYGRSGMSSKMINGVHTLFRSAAPNVPGAIRTVSVTNITLVPDTVAASTSAPATAVAAADTATPVVAASVAATPVLLPRNSSFQLPAPQLRPRQPFRPSSMRLPHLLPPRPSLTQRPRLSRQFPLRHRSPVDVDGRPSR